MYDLQTQLVDYPAPMYDKGVIQGLYAWPELSQHMTPSYTACQSV